MSPARLSVNLNKVALLRNARGGTVPDLTSCAEICLRAGAHGITLHPRPDRRHALAEDVVAMRELLAGWPGAELNVEGNPFPAFLELVERVGPHQCTLVPDAPDALTSDRGWDFAREGERLRPVVARLRARGIRVSLFVEPEPSQAQAAARVGADRVELFTARYARSSGTAEAGAVLERYAATARAAAAAGVGVNAGHDLDLHNLPGFRVPGLLEVSIGQALVADALIQGLDATVRAYLAALGHALPAASAPPATASTG
ncbi:MAG TPA: pyridoxine 5'-phosphate synthase [Longimicrobiaceae bacterium]|nr:pyridoxine 5'-phosphate synthase [Longimicrobiaceae bacterium]